MVGLHNAFWLASFLAIANIAAAGSSGVIESSGHSVGFGELQEEWRGEVIHISWAPRIFLLKGFLSDEECDHIIAQAKPTMERSNIVDAKTGEKLIATDSTSTGTLIERGVDKIIQRVENRVAQVSMIPSENQDNMQVLHYAKGQGYGPHYDYFNPDVLKPGNSNGSQRAATMVMYLSTVEEGGETSFPKADKKVSGAEWSSCAKAGGYAIKPSRGDAVLFYSLRPDGQVDDASLHGSCPVIRGEKWTATKWIHTHKFTPAAI